MITSIFKRPANDSQRSGQQLFKKPETEAAPAQPLTEDAAIISAKSTISNQRPVSSTAAAIATATALPGPQAALYQSLLCIVAQASEGPQQLESLLSSGKLDQDTLENLNQLTQKPRIAGLDGASLTCETVAILSQPDQNIWQGNRFTCGVTNLERQLADDPKTFSQIVLELSNPAGIGHLGSTLLPRATGSQYQDDSGRCSTDRLIQSSLMAWAGAARGSYNVEQDCFNHRQDRGLKISEISSVTAAAQKQTQVVIAYGSKSAAATQELLHKLEPGDTFQTAMTNWDGQDHMLLWQKCDNGQVTYFDPAQHAQKKLPIGDYLWKTQYLILPENLAQRVTFAPESIHSQITV